MELLLFIILYTGDGALLLDFFVLFLKKSRSKAPSPSWFDDVFYSLMYNCSMENRVKTIEDIEKQINDSPAILIYISTEGCNVCRELKPKIMKLLDSNFPKIKFLYINLDEIKKATGRLSVFAVPTILVYFEGKEFFREGRNLGTEQFREKLERPYSLFFE